MLISRFQFRLAIVLLAVSTRLFYSISYIEDPDSMRFALSLLDFDVTRLQPHFPAYPVFCFVAKCFYFSIGYMGLTFALIGAVGSAVAVIAICRLAEITEGSASSLLMAIVVIFNPLFGLLSTRYMPDSSGVALALISLALLLSRNRSPVCWGWALAGLLAGWRLSYLPLLGVPLLFSFMRQNRSVMLPLYAIGGSLVWLIPLVAITGLENLWAAARVQAEGHFLVFGGGVQTEPDLLSRLLAIFQSVWADGLGMAWSDRHWLAVIGSAAALITLFSATGKRGQFQNRSEDIVLWLSFASYLIWIFLYQNVLHKPRHVLPLVLLVITFLFRYLGRPVTSVFRRRLFQTAGVLAIMSLVLTSNVLYWQHRQPSAIAQIVNTLRQRDDATSVVAAAPLVIDFLQRQDVPGQFVRLTSRADLDALKSRKHETFYTVGDYRSWLGDSCATVQTYYHNPYVNRMWPLVDLVQHSRCPQ